MTATNHALTGSLIGLAIGQPLLALPLALVSHYICDALPHFGTDLPDEIVLKTRWYRNYLVTEALLCLSIVLILASVQPLHWQLAAICAFVAAAPDLISFNRYITVRRGRIWKSSAYSRFAGNIQWFEHPIGAVVEVAWFVGMLILIRPFM
jgi:hypothetical protein